MSSDFSNISKIASKSKQAKKSEKRKKLKKPKERSMKAVKRELWELCRQITFKRYGANCYTCPQINLVGSNKHCGHYYPKGAAGTLIKYDLRILRPQCRRCNTQLGGMGGTFRENMKKEIGVEAEQKLYDECSASKGSPINGRDYFPLLIEQYKLLT